MRRTIAIASSSARASASCAAAARPGRDRPPSGDSSPSSAAGTCGQVVGQRRRGAQHGGDPLQQRRLPLQQRQQLHPGRQPAEQRVGAGERRVRLALRRPARAAGRQHRLQQRARPLGAEGARHARPPGRTAARTRSGSAKPMRAQAVRAERRRRAGQAGREQAGVVLRTRSRWPSSAAAKACAVREPHEAGEPLHPGRVGRQACGSAGPPPSAAGARRCAGSGRRPPASAAARGAGARPRPAPPARRRCVGSRSAGVAAAPHQLHGLRRELHAADAALAQLHVMPGHPRDRVRRVAPGRWRGVVHPALHGADVGDGGEIQVAAPDEGPDLAQEALAQGPVPGHRARLDHGGPLPVLAHALVIGECGGQADGGRRGAGSGRRRRSVRKT